MKTKHPRRPKLPPNVSSFVDRHGKLRHRYRRAGQRAVYLPGYPGSSEFDRALDAARGGAPLAIARAVPGSVGDLVARYYRSTTFLKAGEDRQRTARGIIEPFRREFAADQVSDFRFDHVEAVLLRKAKKRTDERGRTIGGPVAAANLKKQLKRMFGHAVKLGWIRSNPVDLAEGVRQVKTLGFHAWNEPEIAQYRKRHPLGTKARLALETILWTWQRRGDASSFGPRHMQSGKIHYTQGKGGKTLWLPAAPQLLEAIAAMPATGLTTFLVTDFGKPFSKAGFGNKMRTWCDEADLPHCTAHGLRKAAARRAADLEATQLQLKAAGGWSGDAEVATYTADADQARLAEAIILKVSAWDRGSGD